MDDRVLAYYDEGAGAKERGENPGLHATLRIVQTDTSPTGLHFIIAKFVGSSPLETSSIYVPDAATFLAPVVEWLDGGADSSGKTDADRLAAVIAEARKMNSEHGQSWNAISGRRILNVLGIEPEEWNPEEGGEE